MRRFSQRNSLVTLNEINITPLLDLAFVLLIIFIIVSGSIKQEQAIDVKLPEGGQSQGEVNERDRRTVTITRQGGYLLGTKQTALEAITRQLVSEKKLNPNLFVEIRCDATGINQDTLTLIDRLTANNITRFTFAMRKPDRR